MITLPEVKIKNIIDSILYWVKVDYNDQADKSNSILYTLCYGNNIGRFDLYTQAIDLFVARSVADARKLGVNYFFNPEKAATPNIHIMLSQESSQGNGIGQDQGYNDNISISETESKITYNHMSGTKINIIITSDSTFEVLTIYHVLKTLLKGVFIDLEFQGIRNPKVSGGDLQLGPSVIPSGVFTRQISLDFMYEDTVPSNINTQNLTNIIINGTPTTE